MILAALPTLRVPGLSGVCRVLQMSRPDQWSLYPCIERCLDGPIVKFQSHMRASNVNV